MKEPLYSQTIYKYDVIFLLLVFFIKRTANHKRFWTHAFEHTPIDDGHVLKYFTFYLLTGLAS
jgi:hypothetical protein